MVTNSAIIVFVFIFIGEPPRYGVVFDRRSSLMLIDINRLRFSEQNFGSVFVHPIVYEEKGYMQYSVLSETTAESK